MHCACADPICAVEGCGRPRHGGSLLCATHKARKLMNLPLGGAIRSYERDPRAMVGNALEGWYEALVRRREALAAQLSQLDEALRGSSEVAQVRQAQARLAEVEASDDEEWRRAQNALYQALNRYVTATARRRSTPKHKSRARRRR